MDQISAFAAPILAGTTALIVAGYGVLMARKFHRTHPHLTRQGLKNAPPNTTRDTGIGTADLVKGSTYIFEATGKGSYVPEKYAHHDPYVYGSVRTISSDDKIK